MPPAGLVRTILPLFIAVPLLGQSPDSKPGATSPSALKLSGYLQAREVYQSGSGLTGSINRARLAASGTVIEVVTWRLQGEFRTGSVGTGRASVSLQDAYIRYNPGGWAVQAGQFKTPFSREFITSLADVETADRSAVVDSLAPKRDIGVMGEYNFPWLTVLGGVFNGEGQNLNANADSTVLGIARMAVRPMAELSMAINAARYFGDSTRYGVDVVYEPGWGTLKGEYLGQHRDSAGGRDDWGWYGLGAVALSQGVQLVGRYEEFEKPAISSPVRIRTWTGGLNVFLRTRNLRLTFDYSSRAIGEPGVRKGRVLGQVQVKF
jgi:Phosphate-selective porin O and P